MTPHAYQVQRRLLLARGWIRAGATLADAAAAGGFSDQSHMTRLFVRAYGLSPPLRGRRASRLSAHSQRPQFRSRPAGGRPPTLHAFPRKGGTSMSSAVSKPLQSSGERMQGYACLAAAMALVGSTVVASKIIAAGLPFHRHRAALRAGAALLPPDHETDRRVPAPTRRARLGVADGAGRRRQRGLRCCSSPACSAPRRWTPASSWAHCRWCPPPWP